MCRSLLKKTSNTLSPQKTGERKKLKTKIAVLLTATLIVSMMFTSVSMLTLAHAQSVPSPSWRTKTAMPTARGQVAVIIGDNGLIYAMGGFAGGASFSTVEAYNPLTDAWSAKAAMPQITRGAAIAKAPNGIIYVIGGFSGGALTTVQAYNTTANTWSTKTAIPTGVWMASATTGNDGKIYVVGGEPLGGGFINETQIYDPSLDSWTTGADMPTARRLLSVVKGADGLIYAMGGYNGTALSVVEAYNPSTDTWTTKASMPKPKVEFGLTLGPDNKIYVIGGGTSPTNNVGPFFDTVEIYDPNTNTWSIPGWSESTMPTARKELGATTGANGMIYAIGGANGAYISTNEEAFIEIPENVAPTAYIDSITPNPATRGQSISFTGHGSDSDGSIAAYKWRSSLNGTLSTSASFSVSTLAVGTHTIYFSVQDNSGAWSNEAVAIVTVNKPITEDPTYQQLLSVNQTLSQRINELKTKSDSLAQQNTNLQSAVDDLTEQNANLTDKVDSLSQKLDTMNLTLLGANIVIIVLVVVTIAVIYMGKRKST